MQLVPVYNLKSKPIKGFESYLIFEDGSVFSIRSNKYLSIVITSAGYFAVNLWKKNKGKTFLVHRLLALAFIPNPDNKPFINHIDNDPKNNSLSNLEWCTQSENIQHAVRQGRMAKGSNHYKSKLTESEVIEIKYFLDNKMKQRDLAEIYNIDSSVISKINTNKYWRQVQCL